MGKKYQLGLYEKAIPPSFSFVEKFLCAKDIGYDFLEISIDETEEKLSRLDWSKAEKKNIINLMVDNDFYFRSMCLSGHRKFPLGSTNKVTQQKSLDIMKKAIDFSNELGIRIIQLAGYDVYYESGDEKTKQIFFDNLMIATEMASSSGVYLGFETMETEFMNTVKKAMCYVNKINSPYLGVYPDLGNITNAAIKYHTNVLEDLECGKGHLFAVHLKESLPNKFREIPFGCGHVDFENTINKSWLLGVRRYVTELWYTGNENWHTETKRTFDFASKIISKNE